MDCLLLLLIVYIMYLLTAVIFSNGRLLSPSVVFSASFTFMLLLAYIFKEILGFRVNETTFQVLSFGGFIFVATEIFVQWFLQRKEKILCNSSTGNELIILSDKVLNFLIIFLGLSTIICIYVFFINTTGESIAVRMITYKFALLYDDSSIEYRAYMSQLYKVNMCIAYFGSYIFIYNLVNGSIGAIRKLKYISIIILFGIYGIFFNAARQPVIEILLFLPLVYLSLTLQRKDRKKVILLLKKTLPVLILLGIIFYYTATMVGRRETERGVLEYIAVYFCGGLYSFNLHVYEPARNALWGQSSFSDIYGVLINLGLISETADMRYHDFDLYGNTVTIFGRWYEDFGQLGVYVMTCLVSAFFAMFFYKKIVPEKNVYKVNHMGKLIYSKFIIGLLWAGYDDRIRPLFSVSTLCFVIGIIVLWRILITRNVE